MIERLPKLAFLSIALACAAATPLGAQGAGEASQRWTWCSEQPSLTAVQGLQESVDLEPHHAAVLAACAEQAAREEASTGRLALEMAAAADF